MDEDEYRSTYQVVNQQRCVFEKALNSRRCFCSRMDRFYLADREGVGCKSEPARQRCGQLLETMRKNARFSLQLTRIAGPLPHNKEIKVQTGGLLGLQAIVKPALGDSTSVQDIYDLISDAETSYGSLKDFPYTEIVKRIVRFEGRPRRTRRDK